MQTVLPRVRGRLRLGLSAALVLACTVFATAGTAQAAQANAASRSHWRHGAHDRVTTPGPLVVSRENPRWFTVAGHGRRHEDKAVLLTGSHVWNTLHDGLGPGDSICRSETQDYGAYLDFLEERGHNFARLWRWDNFRSSVPGFHLCMTPQPWKRLGPPTLADGQPAFDLTELDPSYFRRLRERVVAAGQRGMYVGVMLFEGFCFKHCLAPWNIDGNPFAAGNNVNGIAIRSGREFNVLPIDPQIAEIQRAYVRKVVDTLHDLPNVLYEIANEAAGDPDDQWGDSTPWQYELIDYVKGYERGRHYDRHPVGMTFTYPNPTDNANIYASDADWVSPGLTDRPFDNVWYLDPPANDGRRHPIRVVLSDTDHYAAGIGSSLWAWKTFVRGMSPLLMDYGIINVTDPLDPSTGVPSWESFEPARWAMGDVLRLANGIDLLGMAPRGDLASTAYALAEPGETYVALQPSETPGPFTVQLQTGRYAVSWHSLETRAWTRVNAPLLVRRAGAVSFAQPFASGAAILVLRRTGR